MKQNYGDITKNDDDGKNRNRVEFHSNIDKLNERVFKITEKTKKVDSNGLINKLKEDAQHDEFRFPFFIFMGGFGTEHKPLMNEGKVQFKPFSKITEIADSRINEINLFHEQSQNLPKNKKHNNGILYPKEGKSNSHTYFIFDKEKSLKDHVFKDLKDNNTYPYDYAFTYHRSYDENTTYVDQFINDVKISGDARGWPLFKINERTKFRNEVLRNKCVLISRFLPSFSQYKLQINTSYKISTSTVNSIHTATKRNPVLLRSSVVKWTDKKNKWYERDAYGDDGDGDGDGDGDDSDGTKKTDKKGGAGTAAAARVLDKDDIEQKRRLLVHNKTQNLAFDAKTYSISRLSLKLHVRFIENDVSIRKMKEITPRTVLDHENVDERLQHASFDQGKKGASNKRANDTTYFVVPLKKCTLDRDVVDKYMKSLNGSDEPSKFGWRETAELFRSEDNLTHLLRHINKSAAVVGATMDNVSDEQILQQYRNFIWGKMSPKIMHEANHGYRSTLVDVAYFLRDYYSYWKYLIFSYDGNLRHGQITYSTERYNMKTRSDWDQQHARINGKMRELMKTPNNLPLFDLQTRSSLDSSQPSVRSENLTDYMANEDKKLREDTPKLSYIFHALMLRSGGDDKDELFHDVFQLGSQADEEDAEKLLGSRIDKNLWEDAKKHPTSLKPILKLAQWFDDNNKTPPTFDGSFRFSHAPADEQSHDDVSIRFDKYYEREDDSQKGQHNNDVKQIIERRKLEDPAPLHFFYKRILLPSQVEVMDKDQNYTKQLYHVNYHGNTPAS